MMFRIMGFTLLLVLLTAEAYGDAEIPDNELPLGVFNTYGRGFVLDSLRDSLRDELGMHFVYTTGYGNDTQQKIGEFYSDSIWVAFRMWNTENSDLNIVYPKYEKCHYVKIEAEDEQHTVRFLKKDGQSDGDWFVPTRGQSNGDTLVVLDSLFYQSERYSLVDDQYVIRYQPYFRIYVDPTSYDPETNVIVAVFRVYSSSSETNVHETLIEPTDTIWTDDFSASDTVEVELEQFYFTDNYLRVDFQLVSHSNCDFKVDWFKVYDDYGLECVEQNVYDARIKDYVTQSWCNSRVLYWYLRDEPNFDMIMPLAHVDSVIRAATDSVFSDTSYAVTTMVASYFQHMSKISSLIEYDEPPVIWADMYSFKGPYQSDCSEREETYYTGYGHEDEVGWGLQSRLNMDIVDTADSITTLIAGENIEWWMVPQAWSKKYRDCADYTDRPPTRSELSCETFMGLCYNARGIVYYAYCGGVNGVGRWNCIRDSLGAPTHVWHELHENVIPYIKAIDSMYLDLTWVRGYTYVDTIDNFQPPQYAYIDTLYAISNSSEDNPDLGWFQVGEFTEGSDKYIMLVNRACSQGPADPTPAPSVTATVRFNTTNLGLGDYVYIIDIATGTCDTDWVGIPDTTYSANLGGTIPFTTVLGPGEGRLFKIVETVQQ